MTENSSLFFFFPCRVDTVPSTSGLNLMYTPCKLQHSWSVVSELLCKKPDGFVEQRFLLPLQLCHCMQCENKALDITQISVIVFQHNFMDTNMEFADYLYKMKYAFHFFPQPFIFTFKI